MYLSTLSITQRAHIQERDRSNSIYIASWVLLGVTSSVFIARQVMKAFVFRKIALDDVLIFVATVFAIGLSITTSLLASKGLGLLGPLATVRAHSLMKGYHASEFLYIVSLCFSKSSLLVIFYTIVAVQRTYRRVIVSFAGFIVLWSIASVVAVAFQCQLSKPWETITSQCFDTRAFWIAYCIIDMSTEVAIIILSFSMVVCLRLNNLRKIAVIACFAPRAVVAAASLIHLIWMYPIAPHGDPEYRLWLPAILSQVHVCLSICTACIPYMVPFFKRLDGTRRSIYSLKTPELQTDGGFLRKQPPLWNRRQKNSKILRSWDSTAVSSLQYERVPQASPQIPTPQPFSPFTYPQFDSRPRTAKSIPTSCNGLSINIPERNTSLPRTTSVASPQTASSFALSPSCTPLLSMHSLISSRNHPTPPPKTHSPNLPTASSCLSNHSPSPVSEPRPVRLSLFPRSTTPEARSSPDFRPSGFRPVHIPPVKALRPAGTSDIMKHPAAHGSHTSIDQSRGSKLHVATQAPKFSTAPHPISPPSTTTSPNLNRRHLSVQELNSPMGAAINHYFRSAAPKNEQPAPVPVASPQGAHRQRNQQVLSPVNTLRTQKPLPRSPLPGTSPDLVRRELALPRDSLVMNQVMRLPAMPPVQDVRSSPRIVVRYV